MLSKFTANHSHDCWINNSNSIDRKLIILLLAVPFPPPNDVHLAMATPNQLTFQWSEVQISCSILSYHFEAFNCGLCSDTTLTDTMVNCTGNYTQILNNQAQCSFAVESVSCDGNAGDFSPAVNVVLSDVNHGTDANTQRQQCSNLTEGSEML